MKNFLQLFLVLLLCSLSVKVYAVDWSKSAYDTYAARDFSSWPTMIETLQTTAFSPSGTIDQQIKVMTCYYGYIGHLLDIKKKDEASQWNKKAHTIFKKLLEKAPEDPRVLALHSMFIAYDIAISPIKAPFQAGNMMSTAKKALQKAPTLYLANLANANILFYFPESLGGDKKESLNYYRKVYDYFVAHPAISVSDWMYLNVMSTIAVVNEAIGNNQEALNWCNKALQVNPGFVYVKTVLLPRMKKNAK